MRKPAILALLILLLFASCKTMRTYQCEGAATDIRRANEPQRAIDKMLDYISGEGKNEPCAYIMLFWGYAQLRDFETAMSYYDKAIELDPGSRKEMEDIIVEFEYFLKARQEAAKAINNHEYEKALSYARFAEDLEPEHYQAYYIAAECLRLMEQETEAAEEYYTSIQKLYNMETVGRFTMPDEHTQRTVYYVGSATIADVELYDKALEVCDMGLEKFPGYVKVERTRARVLYDSGDPRAEEAYKTLVANAEAAYNAADEETREEAKHDFANSLSDAGIYYMTRKEMAFDDLVVAVEYLETAFFEIDPDNKSVVKNLYLTYNTLKYTEDDPKVKTVAQKYEELFGSGRPALQVESAELTYGEHETRSISGIVRNNSDHSYSYVQVTVPLYDSGGNLVESAMDNVNNLNAGGTWKFNAIVLTEGELTFRMSEIEVSGR
jgi:tetratricopeptide (TPR) repeat protein